MAPFRNTTRQVEAVKPYNRAPVKPTQPNNSSSDEEETLPANISPEQQKVWQDIANKLNQRFGGDKTWQDCAKRWNSLHLQTMKKVESYIDTREGRSPGAAVRSAGFTEIDKAVLRALDFEQNPLEIQESTPQQTHQSQNSDHSYSTQSNSQSTTATPEIKKEKDDVDDVVIKEEVEMDEFEEFNNQSAPLSTTKEHKDKIGELVPALVDCVKSISNLANAMCGAIEDLRKIAKDAN